MGKLAIIGQILTGANCCRDCGSDWWLEAVGQTSIAVYGLATVYLDIQPLGFLGGQMRLKIVPNSWDLGKIGTRHDIKIIRHHVWHSCMHPTDVSQHLFSVIRQCDGKRSQPHGTHVLLATCSPQSSKQ